MGNFAFRCQGAVAVQQKSVPGTRTSVLIVTFAVALVGWAAGSGNSSWTAPASATHAVSLAGGPAAQQATEFIWLISRPFPGLEDLDHLDCWGVAVSPNGRYVAFASKSPDLVPGDESRSPDLFIYDRVTKQLRRVLMDGASCWVSGKYIRFSPDGNFIAFTAGSDAPEAGDTNGMIDAYLYDITAGTFRLVSSLPSSPSRSGWDPAVSANGTAAAFTAQIGEGAQAQPLQVYVTDFSHHSLTLVSKNSVGQPGNADSWGASISADARFVAFISKADNLVPGDTNGHADVFLYDRQTGTLRLVTKGYNGQPADNDSGIEERSAFPQEGYGVTNMSADGRYIVFTSWASNLVPNDGNSYRDVFVYDRVTGTIECVSVKRRGWRAEGGHAPSISADGRYIVFATSAQLNRACATCLPEWWTDTNDYVDIYLWDNLLGTVRLVSRAYDRSQSNGDCDWPSISPDGRWAAFLSLATNLVDGGAPWWGWDVFLVDITRVPGPQTADLDHDGRISDTEMAYIVDQFAQARAGHGWDRRLDLNGDGCFDYHDVMEALEAFLKPEH